MTDIGTPVTLVTGRLSPGIGGPYQTMSGYLQALRAGGHPTDVLAIAGAAGSAPARWSEVTLVPAGEHRAAVTVLRLCRLLWQRRGRHVLVFGVWHAGFFAAAILAWLTGRRFTLVPTQSLMAIDWDKHARIKRALRPLVGLTLRHRSQVILASDGERSASAPLPPAGRVHVVHHPLAEIPGAGVCGDPASRQLVFVGRLAPQKNLELALQAVARLGPEWSLKLCGSGSENYESELADLADFLQIRERVHFTGWCERSQLRETLRHSFAAVWTSHSENYCHGAVECMDLGIPGVMVDRIASGADFAGRGAVKLCAATPKAVAAAVEELAAIGWQQLQRNGLAFAAQRRDGAADDIVSAVRRGFPTTAGAR